MGDDLFDHALKAAGETEVNRGAKS